MVVLPDSVFQKANQEVALLIAHNLSTSGKRFRSALVNKEDYKAFTRTGEPTWQEEHTTPLQGRTGDVRLWRTPLQSLWDALEIYATLGELAAVHRGIEYNRPGTGAPHPQTPKPS